HRLWTDSRSFLYNVKNHVVMEWLRMKRSAPIQPCEPPIFSLIRAAVEWCFSLLFHAGSEPPNVLDGKGFQPSPIAHSPCIRENLPANREWREHRRSEFKTAAARRASREREPRNGIGFARGDVDWFLMVARASVCDARLLTAA